MTAMYHITIASDLGPLTLREHDGHIVAVDFCADQSPEEPTALLGEAHKQIDSYLAGTRRSFDLPYRLAGTPFQHRVWNALVEIPFGTSVSYGDLARRIASGPRAVGGACGKNPLPLIVPCHRVLAANSRLGGYSAGSGAKTKQTLLSLEGITLNEPGNQQ